MQVSSDTDVFTGEVMQVSTPMRSLPPAEFVLADPTVELPLLSLLVKPTQKDASPVRVLLWGVWCDRLCEVVERGSTITVHGSSMSYDPMAPVGQRATLVLPPAGAAVDASVQVRYKSQYIEVTADRVLHRAAGPRDLVASPISDAASRTDGNTQSKRRKGGVYEYCKLNQLPDRTGLSGGPKEVHVFGVVFEYMLPRVTRGSDMKSVLRSSCSTQWVTSASHSG